MCQICGNIPIALLCVCNLRVPLLRHFVRGQCSFILHVHTRTIVAIRHNFEHISSTMATTSPALRQQVLNIYKGLNT